MKTGFKGTKGFSLIELLVVISITGALMGILLPALARARALAKQVVCQSRLRQWGLAFEVYAIENNGYYPHIDGRDRQGDSKPWREIDLADWYYGWIDVLPPLMGAKPWRDYGAFQHPGPDTIYQCPIAKLRSNQKKLMRNGYFSYAMNSCLELDKNCVPPHDKPDGDNMPSFLQTAKIVKPSQTILLFEQLLQPEKGYGGTDEVSTAGQHCGSYPKAFSARHRKPGGVLGGSILFCDYHIEWRSTVWRDEWPEGLEAPFRNDLDWFPY